MSCEVNVADERCRSGELKSEKEKAVERKAQGIAEATKQQLEVFQHVKDKMRTQLRSRLSTALQNFKVAKE